MHQHLLPQAVNLFIQAFSCRNDFKGCFQSFIYLNKRQKYKEDNSIVLIWVRTIYLRCLTHSWPMFSFFNCQRQKTTGTFARQKILSKTLPKAYSEHVRWSILQKKLTAFIRQLFLQDIPTQIFDRVQNMPQPAIQLLEQLLNKIRMDGCTYFSMLRKPLNNTKLFQEKNFIMI